LRFVSCDGAEWIRTVVADAATGAVVCLDTFDVIGWATVLDEVRREEWNTRRVWGQTEPGERPIEAAPPNRAVDGSTPGEAETSPSTASR